VQGRVAEGGGTTMTNQTNQTKEFTYVLNVTLPNGEVQPFVFTSEDTGETFIKTLSYFLEQAAAKLSDKSRTFVTAKGAKITLPAGVVCMGCDIQGSSYTITFQYPEDVR
jgi:hypothetical protein